MQIDIPEAILPRFGHTAVFGDNPDCRQLMLWGGRKIWGGSPIGETTLLTLCEYVCAAYRIRLIFRGNAKKLVLRNVCGF